MRRVLALVLFVVLALATSAPAAVACSSCHGYPG